MRSVLDPHSCSIFVFILDAMYYLNRLRNDSRVSHIDFSLQHAAVQGIPLVTQKNAITQTH
jgi:hypothetical protein